MLANITAAGGSQYNPGGAGTVWLIQGRAPTHVKWFTPVPRNGGYVSDIDALSLRFSRRLDTNSVNPSTVQVVGPLGVVPHAGFVEVAQATYRIAYGPQTENGSYRFALSQTLLDTEGFQLDENANGIPGEPEDAFNFTLILDTVPPHITHQSPAGDVAGTLSFLDVWFSEKMDASTLSAADVVILGPATNTIPVTAVQEVGLNRFRFSFAQQTAVGLYTVAIGTNIFDLAGNPLTPDHGLLTVNVVEVDIQLSDVTLSTNQTVAGDPLQVSWNARNASGAPLLGSWTDGIYLSRDGKWDIGDILVATIPHTGGLASNGVYAVTNSVMVPGALPGDYQLLIRSDVYNQEREGPGESDNVFALPLAVAINELVIGTPRPDEFIQNKHARYFFMVVTNGEDLRLKLDSAASSGAVELYVRRDALPTRVDFDWKYGAPLKPDQTIRIPGTKAGTYYVLAYADNLPSLPSSFTVAAEYLPLTFTQAEPRAGGNMGKVTVKLIGSRFTLQTRARLVHPDFGAIEAIRYYFESMEAIYPTFNMQGLDLGTYDIQVDDPESGSRTLSGALAVADGGGPKLEARLDMPGSARAGTPFPFYVEYSNRGLNDMPAPLLLVEGDRMAIYFEDDKVKDSRKQQILGISGSGPAGVLKPGDVNRVKLWASRPGKVTLRSVTRSALPIAWERPGPSLRPPGYSSEFWATNWSRFTENMGQTWLAYVKSLAEHATLISQFEGRRVNRVRELLPLVFNSAVPQQAYSAPGSPPPVSASGSPADDFPLRVCRLPGCVDDSPYGWRLFNRTSFHDGVDLAINAELRWPLPMNGMARNGYQNGYGRIVEVLFPGTNRDETLIFAHLGAFSAGTQDPQRKPGSRSISFGVAQDSLLGHTGTSGMDEGDFKEIRYSHHLHLKRGEKFGAGNQGGNPLQFFAYTSAVNSVDVDAPNPAVRLTAPYINLSCVIDVPTLDLESLEILCMEFNGTAFSPPEFLGGFSYVTTPRQNNHPWWTGTTATPHNRFTWDTRPVLLWPLPAPDATGDFRYRLRVRAYTVRGIWKDSEEFVVVYTQSGESGDETDQEPDPDNDTGSDYGDPNVDTDGDGTNDAWDTNGDGMEDAWDFDGDGSPDHFDTNDDGAPDPGGDEDENGDGDGPGGAPGGAADGEDSNETGEIRSYDPNDKSGPAGFGVLRYVTAQVLPYTVRFENLPAATAAALKVEIRDQLDSDMDWSTLEIEEIGFGGTVIKVPKGLNHYEGRMLCDGWTWNTTVGWHRSANSLGVEVKAGVDAAGLLSVVISATDTNSGYAPEDIFAGFLPPNQPAIFYPNPSDTNTLVHPGEGYVSYLVKPKSGLTTGTAIANRASIYFDYSDPIDTPLVSNTIDAAAPTSTVAPLPAEAGPTFLVQWTGQDDAGGSGLASFDIHVTENGTNQFLWQSRTTATSAWFRGQPGSTYGFFSVARDNIGQEEPLPSTPQAFTTVPTNAPVLAGITNFDLDVGTLLEFTNAVSGAPNGDWRFSLGWPMPPGVNLNPTNGVLRWTPSCANASSTNTISVWVTDTGNTNLADVVSFTAVVHECVVPGLGRIVLRVGESGRVPINLISSVPLTNLSMTVEAPSERLTNFSVELIVPEICTNSIAYLSNSLHLLSLTTCSNQWLIGTQQVAWLHFSAASNQSSAFVTLNLDNITGFQPDGTPILNFAPQAGRVVIVGAEPLLEALPAPYSQVVLLQYALPGSTIALQWTTNLPPTGGWLPSGETTQTNLVQETVTFAPVAPALFFRAIRGSIAP